MRKRIDLVGEHWPKIFLVFSLLTAAAVAVAALVALSTAPILGEETESMKLERVAVIGQVGNTCTLQFTFSWDSIIPDAEVLEFVSKFGDGAAIIAISPKKIIFTVPGVFLSRAYRDGRG